MAPSELTDLIRCERAEHIDLWMHKFSGLAFQMERICVGTQPPQRNLKNQRNSSSLKIYCTNSFIVFLSQVRLMHHSFFFSFAGYSSYQHGAYRSITADPLNGISIVFIHEITVWLSSASRRLNAKRSRSAWRCWRCKTFVYTALPIWEEAIFDVGSKLACGVLGRIVYLDLACFLLTVDEVAPLLSDQLENHQKMSYFNQCSFTLWLILEAIF